MNSRLLYFLITTLVTTSIYAEVTSYDEIQEQTLASKQKRESQSDFVSFCVPLCQKLLGDSQKMWTTKFKRNCQLAYQRDQHLKTWKGSFQLSEKVAGHLVKQCIPKAVKKSIIDPVAALIGLLFGESKESDFPKKMQACDASKDCRRALARYMVKFHHINSEGNFHIPDEQVDRQIASIPIKRLFILSTRGKNSLTKYCNNELRPIAESTYALGRNRSAYQNQKIVFDKLLKKNAFCPSLLKMSPPIDQSQLPELHQTPFEKLTTFQKVAVALTCVPDEANPVIFKTLMDACSDIYSVVVPIPVLEKLTKAKGSASAKHEAIDIASTAAHIDPSSTAKIALEDSRSSLSKTEFVSKYKSGVYATERQNEVFIQMARQGPLPNRRYFDTENSAMKLLNDTTKDKDLVTALTNYHKEATLKQMKALQAKYPDVKFNTYSDFKSIKLVMDTSAPISSSYQKKLLTDLNEAFGKANKEFKDEMGRLGLDTKNLGDPESWFRAGFGKTVDEASLAARKARMSRQQLGVLDFNTSRVQGELVREGLKGKLYDIERQRRQIARSPSFRRLVSKESNGKVLPQVSVFDLVRKNSDPTELADSISKRYGINFTKADAELLLKYSKGVDELSPPILIGKRETPALDSPAGGLSADFLGLGASNLRGTAAGLAGRQGNLSASIKEIRRQEENVTQLFQRRKDQFARTAGGKVVCTGDDCVKALERTMSDSEKMNLMQQVANNPDTKGVRMSFVAPQVPSEFQMAIATHGESIEKALRKRLEGQLNFEKKLQNITFGLDMRAIRMNEGHVDLLIGKANGTRISAREHQKIQKAFEEVMNEGFSYNPGTSRMQSRTIRLIPNPAALTTDNQNNE